MGAEAWELAGLYDPDAPDAADRLALLEWLLDQGFSFDEVVEGGHRGRLTGLVGDRVIRPGRRCTIGEVAAESGISVERIQQVRRAVGLRTVDAQDPVFTDADVSLFASFEGAVAIFGEQAGFQFLRVLGSSLARLADTVLSMFLLQIEQPLIHEGGSQLALAKANLETTQAFNVIPEVMNVLFREHMEEAIRFSTATRSAPGVYDTVHLAVGFVDLVGFTPLSQQLGARELAELVGDFEATAFDLVAAHEGRVVKLIGDEVMFATASAPAACEVALGLAAAYAGDDSVTPRGGVAVGEVLTRGGDYYGEVVNLASRVADLAVPSEILTTTAVRDEAVGAGAALGFESAGRRILKGFAEPVALFTVQQR